MPINNHYEAVNNNSYNFMNDPLRTLVVQAPPPSPSQVFIKFRSVSREGKKNKEEGRIKKKKFLFLVCSFIGNSLFSWLSSSISSSFHLLTRPIIFMLLSFSHKTLKLPFFFSRSLLRLLSTCYEEAMQITTWCHK